MLGCLDLFGIELLYFRMSIDFYDYINPIEKFKFATENFQTYFIAFFMIWLKVDK